MGDHRFECPRWLKRGVMYQIFPDRFARSGAYKAPLQDKEYVLREDWGGEPYSGADEAGVVRNNDFFGGNLRGIIEMLPYLKELGVTVIYLNPIFEAYSNHRYDTADYKKIDPLLGSEEDFVMLCRESANRGIRIILDGVFNHTGSDSVYFNKYGRYPGLGAYQSKDSPYYEWYRFRDYPDDYESWWGIDTLPGLDETKDSYLDYIIRDPDSVVRQWLKAGASGYRLDVVDELPDLFLEEFRRVVKEENPDAAIIGEVWEDAMTKISYGKQRHYLDGTQLDSVMNYPLKDAIIQYVTGEWDAAAFGKEVESLWENYPETAFNGLMNILGTHDTVRIRTVLSQGVSKAEGKQRLFLALLPWALMPGIPCIYYGDENGMEGGRDPENRRCFQPEIRDEEIFAHYKRLMAFRNRIVGIEELLFSPVMASGDYYVFERVDRRGANRQTAARKLIVALNAGSDTQILDLRQLMELPRMSLEKSRRNEPHTGVLKDFFISGDVRFLDLSTFEIGSCSGVAVYVAVDSATLVSP